MRRIRLVLALAAVLVAMLVATAAPAMARGNGVNEERGESPRLQAAEENRFVSPFFISPFVGFNNGFVPGILQVPTVTFVSGSNTNNAGSVIG